jgi:hypothetical protein
MEFLSAYYQCFGQRKSLNKVLESFRAIYASEKVVMVCDGGEDFSGEADKYGCEYFYEDRIHSYEGAKSTAYADKEGAIAWASRFGKYLQRMDSSFTMLLEDDVRLFKPVIASQLKYEINGCNKGAMFESGVVDLIRRKQPDCGINYYGAFGGCLLKNDFFKSILSDAGKIREQVEEYAGVLQGSNFSSDTILSYLCLVNGGMIGSYSGICETWYPDYLDRLNKKQIEILHQYKNDYE